MHVLPCKKSAYELFSGYIPYKVFFIRPTRFGRIMAPSVDMWLSTGITTCRISFDFTDIIHLVRAIHDTGNCSSPKKQTSMERCFKSIIINDTDYKVFMRQCVDTETEANA